MEPVIEKAENKLEYLSSNEKTMSMYWERERSLHERANMIISAEEKGRIKEKLNIAISLLDVLDDETIAIKTGLEINEVRKLRLENTK